MAVSSYVVPNIIQGISHQAPEQRHPNQVQDQQNCFNSPLLGVVARPSLDFVKSISANHTNAAFYEIFRNGVQEHYLAVIDAGELKVYDLADGTLCTITVSDSGDLAYLSTSGDIAKGQFRFQTVDDYTFIANTQVPMAMTSDVKGARPPEALVFVKAGGYSMDYAIAITYGGNLYTWAYTTPDNSVEGNAPYISTAQIASTFYQALTGTSAVVPTSGDPAPRDYLGTGPLYAGSGGGVGAITALSLGFSVEIRGNVLRIWRASDSNDFQISTTDSVGDTYMAALKDTVNALNDLPQKAMVGFRLKVQSPDATSSATAYYVEFTADDVWEETLKAGEHTKLDATTMPHALINTGYRTFTYTKNLWDDRIVGDSESAPLPYAIGKTPQDLGFCYSRLAILNDAAIDFTKTRNEFDLFPDTVQADLATAPINIPIQGARSISLAQRIVLVDESLFVWAQQAQFRLDSGAQPFQQNLINNKLNSAHTFAANCPPLVNGSTLYFAADLGDWTSIRTLAYATGKAAPPTDVTAHVPDLIPSGVRSITGNDTTGVFFVQTDGDPTALYVYNNVVQGSDIVQSAWNRWVFPCDAILWSSVVNNTLYVAMQRDSEFVLATIYLFISAVDPSGQYSTRLDLRCTEAQVSMSYDALLDQTTITPPTSLTASLAAGDVAVVIRTTPGSNPHNYIRGSMPKLVNVPGKIVVPGDLRSMQFYMGVLIDAWTDLSEFYPRNTAALSTTASQSAFFEYLTVRRVEVSHAGTIYYTSEVTHQNGTVSTTAWSSRTAGIGGVSITGAPTPAVGILDIPIKARSDQHSVRLRNRSPWPSRWQRVKYIYEAINRGAPDSNS